MTSINDWAWLPLAEIIATQQHPTPASRSCLAMLWSSKLITICYIVCAVASFSEVGAVTETAETFGIVQFGSSAAVNANKVPEPIDKLGGNAGVNEGVGVGASVNLSGLGDVNNGNSAAANVATVDPIATTTSSSKQVDAQNAVKSGLRSLRPEI